MKSLRRVAMGVGGALGIPVYFGLEALIRLLNVGRGRPLVDAEIEVVAAACNHEPCRCLGAVELDLVRIASNALLPIAHRAITLGRTVFVKGVLDMSQERDRSLLVHELVHVAQRERHGRVGMARLYSAHFCDGFSYRKHVMEIEARAVAAAAGDAWSPR